MLEASPCCRSEGCSICSVASHLALCIAESYCALLGVFRSGTLSFSDLCRTVRRGGVGVS